ncbi:hypothetical protein BH20ACT5_BH20ACT5_23810 [soil metagenome]
MSNETVITVAGRIATTPKRRVTDAGTSVTNFRVASTSRRFVKETQEWVDGDTLWLNVACWRPLADNVARSLVQGDPVVLTGRVYSRDYEHEGQQRRSTDVEVYSIGPDLGWGQADFTRLRRTGRAPEPASEEAGGEAGEEAEDAGPADYPEARVAVA